MNNFEDLKGYKEIGELGKGEFSTVIKVLNSRGIEFAIKQVSSRKLQQNPKLATMFENEIKIQNSLNHPAIVETIECFNAKDNFNMVYEYCEGGSLKNRLQNNELFSENEAIKVGYQIAQAILYLEHEHLIHRDVKPENILIKNGKYKLADFGFCTNASKNDNGLIGSPLYMAPESLGNYTYTIKNDVYGLGVTLFELVTRKVPFFDHDLRKLYKMKMNQNLSGMSSNVSQKFRDLIGNMLQPYFKSRYTPTDVLEFINKNYPQLVTSQMNSMMAKQKFNSTLQTSSARIYDQGVNNPIQYSPFRASGGSVHGGPNNMMGHNQNMLQQSPFQHQKVPMNPLGTPLLPGPHYSGINPTIVPFNLNMNQVQNNINNSNTKNNNIVETGLSTLQNQSNNKNFDGIDKNMNWIANYNNIHPNPGQVNTYNTTQHNQQHQLMNVIPHMHHAKTQNNSQKNSVMYEHNSSVLNNTLSADTLNFTIGMDRYGSGPNNGFNDNWRMTQNNNSEFVNLNDIDPFMRLPKDDNLPRRSRYNEYRKAASVGKKLNKEKPIELGYRSRANSPARINNNDNLYYKISNKYGEFNNEANYEKKGNQMFYNPLQKPFAFAGDNRGGANLSGLKKDNSYSKYSPEWLNSTMPNSMAYERFEPGLITYRAEKNILMKNWLGHVSSTDLWSNNF